MRIVIIPAFLALSLVACAPAGGPVDTAAGWGNCVALFRHYDLLEQSVRRPDNRTIPPGLDLPIGLLRQGGCITVTADLAAMESLPVAPVTDGGAAIAPTSLHVGVVTSTADDARSIAFFQARGVQARSVGAAGLGRRIYVGPFRTDGALNAARELALSAGFAYPYAVQF